MCREANKLLVKTILSKTRDFFFFKRSCNTIVPNSYALYGVLESDLLAFNKNGFIHEVEVKISKKDFKKDFVKITNAVWDKRIGKDHKFRDLYPTSDNKHEMVGKGLGPNYFWFVVPKDLITVDEVPAYAGLLYLVEKVDFKTKKTYHKVEVAKDAPKIHKHKYDSEIRNKALVAVMFKYWGDLKKSLG